MKPCGPSITPRTLAHAVFVGVVIVTVFTTAAAAVATSDEVQRRTVRVSVSSTGGQGHGDSGKGVSISADARFVAFASDAPHLVEGDTNGVMDIFVRDLVARTTERVSVASDGSEANGRSDHPSVSSDGRFVAFSSGAWNLVGEDGNGATDVFLRDRLTGTTELVSAAAGGDHGNAASGQPDLSGDGRSVAFASDSTNLVRRDRNAITDIFVKDVETGAVHLASLAWDGGQADRFSFDPSISDDGSIVGFVSLATNLVQEPNTNGADNVYVRDRIARTTVLASAGHDGGFVEADSKDPAVSGDGRSIAFESNGPLLESAVFIQGFHIYDRDIATGAMQLVDVNEHGVPSLNSFSIGPSLSRQGRYVVFSSDSGDLVPGDTNGLLDVFVRDVIVGATVRASVSSTGEQGNAPSGLDGSDIAGDGSVVAFPSSASDLVRHDTNDRLDVFLRGPLTG